MHRVTTLIFNTSERPPLNQNSVGENVPIILNEREHLGLPVTRSVGLNCFARIRNEIIFPARTAIGTQSASKYINITAKPASKRIVVKECQPGI